MSNRLSKLLLDWYAREGRELPWRVKGKAHPDPYVILVSEIMLQQTGVKTVIPYFARFMGRFPTVQDLAAAEQKEVYLYWQGLGYYSRARSLQATARVIVHEHGGRIPDTETELLKLKGIGPYTAASLLTLAFNKPATVVDGNVIRVICRLYNLADLVDVIRPLIKEKAEKLMDRDHPADYASAIMDLGATLCTQKKPDCPRCPWQKHCMALKEGKPENIPKLTKLLKKEKNGGVYLITNRQGEVFISKRQGKGLLSGLYEFPWVEGDSFPFATEAEDTGKKVSHTFTHFKLNLQIYTVKAEQVPLDGEFIAFGDIGNYPFSTLMKKVLSAYKGQKHIKKIPHQLTGDF